MNDFIENLKLYLSSHISHIINRSSSFNTKSFNLGDGIERAREAIREEISFSLSSDIKSILESSLEEAETIAIFLKVKDENRERDLMKIQNFITSEFLGEQEVKEIDSETLDLDELIDSGELAFEGVSWRRDFERLKNQKSGLVLIRGISSKGTIYYAMDDVESLSDYENISHYAIINVPRDSK